MSRSPKPSLPLCFSSSPSINPHCSSQRPAAHYCSAFICSQGQPLAVPLLLSLFFSPHSLYSKFLLPRKVMNTSHQSSFNPPPLPHPLANSHFWNLDLQLCSSKCYYLDSRPFRFTLPPGQRAPNVPRPQHCAVNDFS